MNAGYCCDLSVRKIEEKLKDASICLASVKDRLGNILTQNIQ
jgi:hypothetical protein